MKIEKTELAGWLSVAYIGTCHDINTEGKIKDIDIDAIYEILSSFDIKNSYSKKDFKLYPHLIFADGGVKEFFIIYEIGSFKFLLAHWLFNSPDSIPNGFNAFVDWLYEKLKPLSGFKIEEKLVFNSL